LRKRLAGLAIALAATAGAIASYGQDLPGAQPLTATPGDPARGRAIVLDRALSSCLFCHEVPGSEGPAGTLGPSLGGVGSKLSGAQLRLRLIDSTRIKPDSIMPPYFRTDGLNRVAADYRGKPILDARQIEDVVAYLQTLQ